jgi:ABC-type multidrug transport system fused ATPase/permease subunit
VSVSMAGHAVLEDLDAYIAPGEHVAIVGASGAGKSSLAALLLGWQSLAAGTLHVDGQLLDTSALARLRRSTAWLSSQVQLWNRSLFDNLRYGVTDGEAAMSAILEGAELTPVIQKLPMGMQTSLGEGGRLLSGGEGQRVRFGRSLHRPHARLVILDEAFRGLERVRRRTLLATARRRWADATLLNITHDVDDTWTFDRVLVMDSGRIVEDGSPNALYRRVGSRYRALIDASGSVRERVWSQGDWKVFRLEDGRLREDVQVSQQAEVLC